MTQTPTDSNQALRYALESINVSAVALVEGDFSQGFVVSWDAIQKAMKALAMQEPASGVEKAVRDYFENLPEGSLATIRAAVNTPASEPVNCGYCGGRFPCEICKIEIGNAAALAPASEPAPLTEIGRKRAICEALGFDPENHHNAAKCPYCSPASEPAPASAPSCCGAWEGAAMIVDHYSIRYAKGDHQDGHGHFWSSEDIAAALRARARAQPCRCGELREALEKVRDEATLNVRSMDFQEIVGTFQCIFNLADRALAATAPRSGESK